MTTSNKIILTIIALLALAALGLSVKNMQSKNRIGYIRNAVVMEKYLAMKEAQEKYEIQSGQYKNNLDTLRRDFGRQVAKYNSEYAQLSVEQQQVQGEYLKRQEMELQQYASSIEKKMGEEDNKLMQGVLNQINAYTQDYAKNNGYDLIFGTTIEGNIMYAGDAYDLTEAVITGLNKEYKEGK